MTTNKETETKSEVRKVYLLGAGASRGSEFELPVMREFFNPKDQQQFPELFEYLDTSWCIKAGDYEDVNLEEVMTHIYMSLEGYGKRWLSSPKQYEELSRLEGIKHQLIRYINHRLDYETRFDARRKHCKIHLDFLKRTNFSKSDSVITLNYDLILVNTIPRTLAAPQTPYDPEYDGEYLWRLTYLIFSAWSSKSGLENTRERAEGCFIPLHGLRDWLFCPNPHCRNHQDISSESLYYYNLGPYAVDKYKYTLIEGEPCNECGDSLQPVLIPPTMQKAFEQFPKIQLLWRLAHEALKNANEFFVVGVSFTESDYPLRWLLKYSLELNSGVRRIHVINPDMEDCNMLDEAKSAQKLKRLLGGLSKKIEFVRYPKMQDYPDGAVPLGIAQR